MHGILNFLKNTQDDSTQFTQFELTLFPTHEISLKFSLLSEAKNSKKQNLIVNIFFGCQVFTYFSLHPGTHCL